MALRLAMFARSAASALPTASAFAASEAAAEALAVATCLSRLSTLSLWLAAIQPIATSASRSNAVVILVSISLSCFSIRTTVPENRTTPGAVNARVRAYHGGILNRAAAVPDNWPPLRRTNEFPWGEVIGGALLASIPITIILIVVFR